MESPLTLDQTARWGAAWAEVALARGIRELVIGWDPRLSSVPMAEAFAGGIGGRLHLCILGLVPTPAVAYAALLRPGAWGMMISASHNPPEDNGIKGFDGLGEKLSEEDEAAVEAAFEALGEIKATRAPLPLDTVLPQEYIHQLEPLDLPADFKIVVDCAHGATAPWAPQVFRGGTIHWLGRPEDGARINIGVGSTHMDTLVAKVRETGADLGMAFDGDGDRCLFVDPQGELVDGDQLVWLLAQDLHERHGALPGVVGTIMSNAGLEQALQGISVPFVRTQVGDKFMLRELGKRNWDLAAEASGHVIQKHVGPSGDGLATALAALRAIIRRAPDQRWSWRFNPWPLRLVNLLARDRKPVESCERLSEAISALQTSHGEDIRLVVRWSGTEPKLRLMVEARSADLMDEALATLEIAARADLALA
jgi:phosphoglucosamine mutase